MQIRQVFAAYDQQENQAVGGFKYCPFCRTPLVLEESGHKLRPTCPSCGFIQFKNPSPAVGVLVVEGNKVLLGKRSGAPGGGKWALPSGYIEYEDDFLTTDSTERTLELISPTWLKEVHRAQTSL